MLKQQISFNLPVTITKQGRRFVAYTPALDISTSATTEKKVKESFSELAMLFLEELQNMGTTEDVLKELGWKKTQKNWNPPQVVASQNIGIKIPSFV